MKAMILAAGQGTRVRPITQVVPKPMIPLLRKPLMETILEHLRSYGVDQVVVNTSHLAPSIEDYFRDGSRLGIEIAYSFEGKIVDGRVEGQALGSAGGLKRIQDFSGFFDDTFLVLCGDALVDVDFGQVLRFHRERNALATIVLREVPPDEVFKYGVVAVDGEGRILQFQEKPKVEQAISNLINTGIYVFEPGVLEFVPSGTVFDIGGQLFPRMVEAGAPLYGISVPFNWVDIGSIPDYWEATRLALQGGIAGYRIPGSEIRPGVHVGINVSFNPDQCEVRPPVYIGSSTFIGDGCRILGPTEIGAGCRIEPGAIIEECILGDYTRASSIAHLEKMIVFGNHCIQPSGASLSIEQAQIGWVVGDARGEWSLSPEQVVVHEMAQAVANEERKTLGD